MTKIANLILQSLANPLKGRERPVLFKNASPKKIPNNNWIALYPGTDNTKFNQWVVRVEGNEVIHKLTREKSITEG